MSIVHEGTTAGGRILRASDTSLITATNSVHLQNSAPGAGSSIGRLVGLVAEPIRIDTPALEANTTGSSGGIFIDSPNARDLQIGGVPGSIFTGVTAARGLQAVDGGEIRLSVNGDLSRPTGTDALCGPTGGTGGPICTNNSDITLIARRLGEPVPNRLHVFSGNGTVRATSTGAGPAGGIFLRHRDLSDLRLARYEFNTEPGSVIDLQNANGDILVDRNVTLPSGGALRLNSIPGREIVFGSSVTIDASGLLLAEGASVRFDGGTINLDAPTTINMPANVGGATVNFNRAASVAGTLTVTGGTANFNASGISNIAGLLTMSAGTLGGTGVVAPGAGMTWTGGTIANTGGVNVTGDVGIGAGAMSLTGPLSTDTLTMTAGTITVANPGSLVLAGAQPSSISGGTLANSGMVRLSGPGDLVLSNGATIANGAGAIFEIDSSGPLAASVRHGGGATPIFNNSGTLRKLVSAGNDQHPRRWRGRCDRFRQRGERLGPREGRQHPRVQPGHVHDERGRGRGRSQRDADDRRADERDDGRDRRRGRARPRRRDARQQRQARLQHHRRRHGHADDHRQSPARRGWPGRNRHLGPRFGRGGSHRRVGHRAARGHAYRVAPRRRHAELEQRLHDAHGRCGDHRRLRD